MTSPTGNDGPDDREPPRDGGPLEAAHYIKGAIFDLSQMARRHGHGVLGYLLDMAQMEAEEILQPGGKRRSGH